MGNKPTFVLGTGLSHDGSACLLKDGRICIAIEKERLTRRKHDGGNDTAAVRYCLDAEGISLSDLTLIVQNANFGMFNAGNGWFRGWRLVGNTKVPVVTISHHLAHAYSAIGTSPFEESAVLVIDGCGSSMDDCCDLQGGTIPEIPPEDWKHGFFEKDSYYSFHHDRMHPVYKDFSPWGLSLKEYPMHPGTTKHSIGGLYQAVSTYIFGGFDDSGKLMGLAPYGKPGVFTDSVFDLRDGRVFVRYDWMRKFTTPVRAYEDFKQRFQHYADIAYWIQHEVENAILYIINSRRQQWPSQNLCYAGGVALNAVANGRILSNTPFKNFYIQPAAGDNGLAIGCAYYGWLEVLKRRRVMHDGSSFFGKHYTEQRIAKALQKRCDAVNHLPAGNHIECAADLLAAGKVVGWFQAGCEFGPRALGNRSILADPRLADKRDFINSRVKAREDFRPFAPSILGEDLEQFTQNRRDDPYMLTVVNIRSEKRHLIPSVVHNDGSARIQTVTERFNPEYYQLLQAFKRRTGLGILLNTSFNRRGMPIVETPEQALSFFLESGLEALVIGKHVIEKRTNVENSRSAAHNMQNIVTQFIKSYTTGLNNLQGLCRFDVQGNQSLTIDLAKPDSVNSNSGAAPDLVIELSEPELRALAGSTEEELRDALAAGRLQIRGNHNLLEAFFRLLQR